ncbi:MAG: hypothetical protein NTZ85_02680, partial [Bacteroidia bacterium]|nr:hypothetical protein [Bacteroidia bacterium]
MLKLTVSNKIRVILLTLILTSCTAVKPLYGIGNINEKPDFNINPGIDSIQKKLNRKHAIQFGSGIGFCFPGFNLDMNCTYISSNLIGGSITLSANMIKSPNTPDDYFDDGHRSFSPKDYVNIISIDFFKIFLTKQKSLRFGFEIGPSFVNYRKAEFESNPDYDPDPEAPWPLWNDTYYLYHKSHSGSSTIGLSVMGKMDFLFKRHNG